MKDYMTFLQEPQYYTGDKSVSLPPSVWANGYTLNAFKITDGPFGPGTYGPRSKSGTESARLEVSFWHLTKTSRWTFSIKCSEGSGLTDLTKFSSYERWQLTLRWRDWLFGIMDCVWGTLVWSLRARRAAWRDTRNTTLVRYSKHRPQKSGRNLLARSLCTSLWWHWTIWFIWLFS